MPEALASGLCVVAYDYAAAGNIIKHCNSGLLVPFNQSKALINTAVDAAKNSDLLKHCKNHSISSVANIRWESVIEELESLLYATANGFKPIRRKSKRARQRAIRLAFHKKLNLIKL